MVSEITYSYNSKMDLSGSPTIRSSQDAVNIFLSKWETNHLEIQESCYLLLLNRANKVKGCVLISKGGHSGTVVDAKMIFSIALKTMSASIVLAHNHPSGNMQPSAADLQLTKKLKSAGEFLDMPLLDHVIISPYGNAYYSFADSGTL